MFKKHPKTKLSCPYGWYANDWAPWGNFDELPNNVVGIGAINAELGRQPKNAHNFFVKYQGQVLFGKDSLET